MSTQSTPEGPGSVSGAPNLPEGVTDTFTSRFVDTGELRCTRSSEARARRSCSRMVPRFAR
jgi:hypothetical protein